MKYTSLTEWFSKTLSLPRPSWRTALGVGSFLFLGVPISGDVVQDMISFGSTWIIKHNTNDYASPAPEDFLSIVLRALLVAGSFGLAWYELNRAIQTPERMARNAKHRRHIVVITSSETPQNLEFLTESRGQVERLVQHYLKCNPNPRMVTTHAHMVGESNDYESVRKVCVLLQQELEDDIAFDCTGGTKVLSIGMAMACIDDRFELQYFSQGAPPPGSPFYSKAVGKLPFQLNDPAATPGLLPIVIDTDVSNILDNVHS